MLLFFKSILNIAFQYLPQSNQIKLPSHLVEFRKAFTMVKVTQSGWEIETQEESEGVRYVARLPTTTEGGTYEVTSALLYGSRQEAIHEAEKLVGGNERIKDSDSAH